MAVTTQLLKSAVSSVVLAAGRHWPELAKIPYEASARWVALELGRIAGVEGLYARQSFAQGDYVPGLSDVDLFVQIAGGTVPDELEILRRVAHGYGRARRLAPWLGELELGTADELRAWLAAGGRAAAEARHWRRLAGTAAMGRAEVGTDFASDVWNDVMLIVATDLHGRYLRGRLKPVRWANLFLRLERYFALMGERREDVLLQDKRAFLAGARDDTIPCEIRRLLERGLANHDYEHAELARLFSRLVGQVEGWAQRLWPAGAGGDVVTRLPAVPQRPPPVTLEVALPNETLPALRERLAQFVAAAEALDVVDRVIVGNGPFGTTGTMGNHSFRCYVLLTQAVDPEGYFAALSAVRATWQRSRASWPVELLGVVSVPLVVTPTMFRALLAHGCPFESFYLRRFAALSDLAIPPGRTLARHARRYSAYAALWLRSLVLPLLTGALAPARARDQSRRLYDALVALAAQRLFLEAGVVATTPAETVAAYGSLLGDERVEVGSLRDAHEALAEPARAGFADPVELCARSLSFARHQQRRIRELGAEREAAG